MKKIIFVAALALGIITSACNTSKKAAEQSILPQVELTLTETQWTLVELSNTTETMVVENPANAFVVFNATDGVFSGFTGCNRFSGSYTTSTDNKITLSQAAATRMFCLKNMEVEKQFLLVLESVNSYSISGDKLTLFNAANEPLARFIGISK